MHSEPRDFSDSLYDDQFIVRCLFSGLHIFWFVPLQISVHAVCIHDLCNKTDRRSTFPINHEQIDEIAPRPSRANDKPRQGWEQRRTKPAMARLRRLGWQRSGGAVAGYKAIDTFPRFLSVNLEKQLLAGSFEHARRRRTVTSAQVTVAPCALAMRMRFCAHPAAAPWPLPPPIVAKRARLRE